jgi:hypothetical protein
MFKTFASLLLVFIALPARADWQVVTDADALPDKVYKMAQTTNAQGQSLAVYRMLRGAVWLRFQVKLGGPEALATGRAPFYRVDQNPNHDLEELRDFTERRPSAPMYLSTPDSISFVLGALQPDDTRPPNLSELLAGARLQIRYLLEQGEIRQASFSLEGAAPMIAQALDIKLAAAPASSAEAAFQAAIDAALKACVEKGGPYQSVCRGKVSTCRAGAGGDLATLQACLNK